MKYLCKYEDAGSVLELQSFKECKKTYIYSFLGQSSKYWHSEIIERRLKKEQLERLGFFIDASDKEDAKKKRQEIILNKLKESIKNFKENFKTNILKFYNDEKSILAIRFPLETTISSGIEIILNNFERVSSYLNTPIRIPDNVYNNSTEEEKEIYNLIKDEFFVFRNWIATENNLTFKLDTDRKYFGTCLINLNHPSLKLHLRDPENLIIEGTNIAPYRDKIININIISRMNNYISNYITYENIAPLYEKLFNDWKDKEIEKGLDYFYLANGYLSTHYRDNKFNDGKILGRRIQYLNVSEYNFLLQEAKKLEIKIEFPDALFMASKDFIISNFKLKNNYIELISNISSDFNIDGAMGIFLREIKKQLGRDDYNTLKLISEVSDE